jgi:hypothetical protein
MPVAGFEEHERFLDPCHDWAALVGACGFTQPGFDAVEVLDLSKEPAGGARNLFEGVVKLSPYVRPAAGQGDRAGPPVGKGSVTGVTGQIKTSHLWALQNQPV